MLSRVGEPRTGLAMAAVVTLSFVCAVSVYDTISDCVRGSTWGGRL